MDAVVMLTFTTTVSGKALTQNLQVSGRYLDWAIRTYDSYGWHLTGYRYLSL
jgi:hypothetical protein